jgi:uncharacterized membrane protein (UPF0127 family)
MARVGTPPARKPAVAGVKPRNKWLLPVGAAAVIALGATGLLLFTGSSGAQVPPTLAPDGTCPADQDCVSIFTDSGEHRFTVEWAIEPAAQTCGLMFRPEMAEDHGMIFDFERDGLRSFWMMNTLISLDMVFIRSDGVVVNVAERTTPLSTASVPSFGPVRYVLELVAGAADRIGLDQGDWVDVSRATGLTTNTAVCATPPPG